MLKKRIAAAIMGVGIAAGVAACGMNGNTMSADSSTGASQKANQTASVDADAGASVKGPAVHTEANTGKSKTAIVYFSEPETDHPETVQGATQFIAQTIQEETGADIFRIVPSEAYPVQHTALVAKGKVEVMSDARPAIQPIEADWSKYDTIFIGYPIWWGTMPMPVYTFLENQDFAGKDMVLFSTHGGSGLAGTVGTITDIVHTARVHNSAFTVSRDDIPHAADKVKSWLRSLDV